MAASAARAEDAVTQLCEIAGLCPEEARPLLEATHWQVEEALSLHFASRGGEEDDERAYQAAVAVRDSDPSRPATAPIPPPLENSRPAASTSSEPTDTPAAQEQPGWFGAIGRRLTDMGQAIMGVASEDFESWFAARYGSPSPTFCKTCFGEAVKAAIQEKRLLLLWFHQEESRATEVLCRDVLQNELALEMIRRRFCLWAGDVGRFEPGQIARLLSVAIFPALVVCQPLRSAFEAQSACLEWPLGTFVQPLFRLTPVAPGELLLPDEAIAALTSAVEDHDDEVRAREAQQALRSSQLAEERRLREEQDREFEESLLQDQLAEVRRSEAASATAGTQAASDAASPRQENAAEEPAVAPSGPDPEQVLAEERRQKEERRRQRGAEILAEPEPAPDGSSTAKLSLRLPSGERLQRTFLAEQRLEEVYEWADCCRSCPDPALFELCTSFPVKVLIERSASLASLGLAPSAALLLKATEG